MNRFGEFAPLQLCRAKGRFRLAIRRVLQVFLRYPRQLADLLAAALLHRDAQVAMEVAEVRERRRGTPLLAHKQHRRLWQQQSNRSQRPYDLLRQQTRDTVAKDAIADQVVALQEGHKGIRWHMAARFKLFLVLLCGDDEPLAQRFPQTVRLTSVVRLTLVCRSHEPRAQQVVDVVIPLRGVALAGATTRTR